MLSRFLRFFKYNVKMIYSSNVYQDYFDQLGGIQFGDGVFNSLLLQDVPKWRAYITEAFPELTGKVIPFGYTWDGVFCCIDLRDGKIILCDVGAGECIDLPRSFIEFLNEDIEEFEELLQIEDYQKWMTVNGKLPYGSCAGLKKPLFMGGEEENSNREVSDLEVYWGIIGQVKRQVKGD